MKTTSLHPTSSNLIFNKASFLANKIWAVITFKAVRDIFSMDFDLSIDIEEEEIYADLNY